MIRFFIKNKCYALMGWLFVMSVTVCSAQVLTNGESITVGSDVEITVKGDVENHTTGIFINEGVLDVKGNIHSTKALTEGNGTFRLSGTQLQHISGNGIDFNNLEIDNEGQGIELADDIYVNGSLMMLTGNINLNSNNIELAPTAALIGENNESRIYGTSGFVKTVKQLNAPNNTNVGGLGAYITSSDDLGWTRIERGHDALSSNGIARYFIVTPEHAPEEDATLRFDYFDGELNSLSEAELAIWKSTNNGTSWDELNGTVNTNANYAVKKGLNKTSWWTLSPQTPTHSATSLTEITATNATEELRNISVYPNPIKVGGVISIKGLGEEGRSIITITDMLGKEVMTKTVELSGNIQTVNIPNKLAYGAYTYSIVVGTQVTTGNLIIIQ